MPKPRAGGKVFLGDRCSESSLCCACKTLFQRLNPLIVECPHENREERIRFYLTYMRQMIEERAKT